MIERQIRRRGVVDPQVLRAMQEVRRHEFVPPELQARAYEDVPLPIGGGQTISQPYIVAAMTSALYLQPSTACSKSEPDAATRLRFSLELLPKLYRSKSGRIWLAQRLHD